MREPYTQLYLHLVWATWDRMPFLTPELQIQIRLTPDPGGGCRVDASARTSPVAPLSSPPGAWRPFRSPASGSRCPTPRLRSAPPRYRSGFSELRLLVRAPGPDVGRGLYRAVRRDTWTRAGSARAGRRRTCSWPPGPAPTRRRPTSTGTATRSTTKCPFTGHTRPAIRTRPMARQGRGATHDRRNEVLERRLCEQALLERVRGPLCRVVVTPQR